MKTLPKSLTRDLFKSIESWNHAAMWHKSAFQWVERKTQDYNEIPQDIAKYKEWAAEETGDPQIWLQIAARKEAEWESGLDAYTAEARTRAQEDQERYLCLAIDHAAEVLDHALEVAGILGVEATRPEIKNPLDIASLPFGESTLGEFCEALRDKNGERKKAEKKTARENIPPFTLDSRLLDADTSVPRFVCIAGKLLSACVHKDNGRDVMKPEDSIVFQDMVTEYAVLPAVARRTLKGWLDASAFEWAQQLTITLESDGMTITAQTETAKTRTFFKWVEVVRDSISRPIILDCLQSQAVSAPSVSTPN